MSPGSHPLDPPAGHRGSRRNSKTRALHSPARRSAASGLHRRCGPRARGRPTACDRPGVQGRDIGRGRPRGRGWEPRRAYSGRVRSSAAQRGPVAVERGRERAGLSERAPVLRDVRVRERLRMHRIVAERPQEAREAAAPKRRLRRPRQLEEEDVARAAAWGRVRCWNAAGWGAASAASPSTRSRWRSATCQAMLPPQSWPITAADCAPACRITAATSRGDARRPVRLEPAGLLGAVVAAEVPGRGREIRPVPAPGSGAASCTRTREARAAV